LNLHDTKATSNRLHAAEVILIIIIDINNKHNGPIVYSR